MAILFESTISGSGSSSFSATRVNYVLYHTITVGPVPKPLSMADIDHCLRIGWFTLGVTVSIPDFGSQVFWRPPIWFNFFNSEWSSIPQTDVSANDFGTWASEVRWALSPGVDGWLQVVGV